jgi:hypothetical protein
MAKSHEMIRLEIPNRIAQANVQAFKVLVIILARKVKEKNMVAKLYQRGMELCRPAGHYAETERHMPPQVNQVLHRLGESDRVGVDVAISLVYDE